MFYTHTAHTRRTDIDDDLMDAAMRAGPYSTKREAVEAGLQGFGDIETSRHRQQICVSPFSNLLITVLWLVNRGSCGRRRTT
ncbi:MAG: type II toxin-antitoxin system VapB family antitoxin [Casimicrobium sp.]